LKTVAREFVTIDGCRLEFQWVGSRERDTATIVFLHEGLGSISQWRDFPARLCVQAGCRGLVYNRQGYGGSDPFERLPPTFMHHEALSVLPRLLDALHIVQPVLFGHSDGGSIALIYAATAPQPPAAVIAEAAHVFVEDVTVARIAELRDAYRVTDLRSRLQRHHQANVDGLFDGWTETWLSAEFRDWNIQELLPRISCPTLVIQGADDEYGTVKQVDALANGVRGPVMTCVLGECGHAPHIDQGAQVLEWVATWLTQARPQ
jgi:pimeloyl-ACP methyl ester carboxylesterase